MWYNISMRYAITDIGSNTVKMHVFDVYGTNISKIHSITLPAKLIQYIENGVMSDTGTAVLCDALGYFKAESEKMKCNVFRAFATAALRRAQNGMDVADAVDKKTGVTIDIISGDDEAALSFYGATRTLDLSGRKGMLLDMGGGSTEAVCYTERRISEKYSMPFGSLSLYNDFVCGLIPTKTELQEIASFALSHLCRTEKCDEVYIVGGTGRALCKLHGLLSQKKVTDIYSIDKTELQTMLGALYTMSDPGAFLKSHVPDRQTTVLPGGYALCSLAERIGAEKMTFLADGIREGYLLSII